MTEPPDSLAAALEHACAQRDALLDAIEWFVRYMRRQGGFMWHEDQMRLRHAEALLVEAGRSVER